MSDPRRLIGLSAIVVGGTLSLAEVERNGSLPSTRQWVGLAAAYLVMSLAADLGAPGLGGGLALLLMLSTLLIRGDDVLAYLGVRIGATPPRRPGRPGMMGGQVTRPAMVPTPTGGP